MQRFSIRKIGIAIAVIALAGAADRAGAADLSQAGFAYGGWAGPASFGYGYAGPAYQSIGNVGGYVGGGGWGYSGSCCANIWDGYCSENRGCGGCGGCGSCRIKHRRRALGCGAGPCCQPACNDGACGAVDCCQPACASAPVCCVAPRPRRHMCCLRRRLCGAGCGVANCAVDGCCGYDGGAVSMPADGPMPEAIEHPAPAPSLDSST